nr:unnamed protein product [Callosobruchus analis]
MSAEPDDDVSNCKSEMSNTRRMLINKSLKFWDLEDYEEELISSCEKSYKFVTAMLYLLPAAALGNCFAFNATALFLGDEVRFLFPIYKPSFIPGFVIYLAQNYIIFGVTAATLSYDGILLSCIVMLEVQFKLLNNKLRTLFVGQEHHIINVDEDIRKCVDHHNYLLKISSGSEKTPNVVFSNNWEDISSPSVKCTIKLIIQRCQKPVSILAGGIFPINLGSGLAVSIPTLIIAYTPTIKKPLVTG